MTTESSSLSAPGMSSETGYELVEDHAPLRVSGFIALILGLLSVLSIIGLPLLLIPITAIAFGLFALRTYDGPAPVGIKPAKLGLVLAAGFGACGFFVPWMKTMTLGSQAEYFARQYLEIVARGELELAMELKKHPVNRYLDNMSLERHYQLNEDAKRALDEFGMESINKTIQDLGPDTQWKLDRATRVFHSFHTDRAELVLVNDDRRRPVKVYLLMVYRPHQETGVGQWHVETCIQYGERLVAESIL